MGENPSAKTVRFNTTIIYDGHAQQTLFIIEVFVTDSVNPEQRALVHFA